MSYEYSWYDYPNVLELKFKGDLSLDQLRELNAELLDYYDKSDRTVTLIVDATDAKKLPNDLVNIRLITQDVLAHPNSGPAIMLGFKQNAILKFLVNVIAQLISKQYKLVQSRDEIDSVLQSYKAGV